MNNVPFKMIIEDLNCGREIEFAYHGKKYSITNSEGYWNFCCDTDGIIIERLCPFNDKTKLNFGVNTAIENGELPQE